MKVLKETLRLQLRKQYTIIYMSCHIAFLSDMTDMINGMYSIPEYNYNNIWKKTN